MFTEKERMILKALLEEEFQSILSYGRNKDALMNKYLFSLAGILSKIDVDEAENTGMERFFMLSEELGAQHAV